MTHIVCLRLWICFINNPPISNIFKISNIYQILFKDNMVWSLWKCLWRGFWILLIFNIVYYSATYLFTSFNGTAAWNFWKQTHGRNCITWLDSFLIFYCCNLISRHTIFHKVRWMLTSNRLFRFPLIYELIVYRLFEVILHGFWLKIFCETADVNHNFSPSCKG